MAEPQLQSDWDHESPSNQEGVEPHTVHSVLVIVGSGPVGLQFAHELVNRGFKGVIKLFGDEPWRPYNRIQLSSLVAGELSYNDILFPEIREEKERFHFLNRRVMQIQQDQHLLTDDKGVAHKFDFLVYATGSYPWIPNVRGVELDGIYVFRDLNDAQKLMARSVRTRKTVVIGGGLLGVEAARAMQRNNTQVVLVHQSNRLMNRQLDVEAGAILKRTLEGYGIEVFLNSGVRHLVGDRSVSAVELRNGQRITCDTIIFSTGIQPNIELARSSGVRISRGIMVNDLLETNKSNVFAIGECAEHQGEIYGLLAPGLEQAAILADRICGGNATYQGSIAATQLKILDLPIFTIGWISDEYENQIDQTAIFHNENGDYRKLFLKRGRLKGFVSIGCCEEKSRLQQAVLNEQRVFPWQVVRFKNEGRLWPRQDTEHVREWPASAIVCNCRGVDKATLIDAQLSGCSSVEALSQCTGASTVCGSCKPLLADLVGTPFEPEPVVASGKPLIAVVFACLLLSVLALLLPAPSYSESFQSTSWLEAFRTDSLLKQITGFTLLGISVSGIFISFRKRISTFSLGSFPWWRFIHTALGLLALVILFLHTGFSLGVNINQYLMLDFVLLAVVGAAAGLVIGSERYTRMGYNAKRMRKWFTHAHIVLFWPLPVLLGFHVLSVYFF